MYCTLHTYSDDSVVFPVVPDPRFLPLDQSQRQLVSLSAPPSGPPTSLPLASQSSVGGSSTLSKKRAPPPPPGHKRALSDPPSPVMQGSQSKGASWWQPLRFAVSEIIFLIIEGC